MVSRRRSAVVLAAAPWLLTARAAVCPQTGAEAPSVTTLMASPENPASEAWTVSPSCDVTVSPLTKRAGATETTFLKLTDENIARIQSLPASTKGFWFAGYKLAGGADLTNAKGLQDVSMGFSSLATVKNIKFPDSVVILNLEQNSITSMANAKLPGALSSLTLSKNKLTAIDFAFPPKLTYLHIENNPITSIVNVTFSDSVEDIYMSGCSVTTVRGTRWPSALKQGTFGTTPITSFEVRASDARLLGGIGDKLSMVVKQSTCEDPTAVLTDVGTNKLCVISDERFETLYGASAATAAPTSDSSGSLPEPTATASAGTTPSLDKTDTITTTSPENAAADPRRTNSASPPSSSAEATSPASSSSNTVVITLAVIGVVLAVVIAVVGYRIFVVPRKTNEAQLDGDDNTDTSHEKYVSHVETSSNAKSGTSSGGNNSSNAQLEQLRNDIRKDGRLAPFRIDERDVQIGGVIARGGFGVIFRGKYCERTVAIKQLLPDTWRENKTLGRFVDEIRLSASLVHPKIVEFIGVSWTSLRDITVVIEFMDGGDLHSVLHGHEQPSRFDWTEQWGSRKIKCKTEIAIDVVEAIAYLHSLPTPILHRDLKAHNVLLDTRGNAKLSDFGISREIALDHTMTSEIGTVAWIAPEVLRGERYSAKADLYSFGVLLVEMDRCRHPYADVGADGGGTGSAYKATQIAVLVSTGELQPSVSSDCPGSVREVVEACVAFDAADRPSANQVLEMLNRILVGGDAKPPSGFV